MIKSLIFALVILGIYTFSIILTIAIRKIRTLKQRIFIKTNNDIISSDSSRDD